MEVILCKVIVTLPVGETALLEDEQIYEDPGHIKEEIYEWFKQRNIFKIDKDSVRYANKLFITYLASYIANSQL